MSSAEDVKATIPAAEDTSVITQDEKKEQTEQGTKRPAPEGSSTEGTPKRQKREPIPERDIPTIRTQIEYYLSDTNLAQDQFFYDIIKNAKDGSIPFERLLSSRKLILMKADEGLLREAAKDSELVEVAEKGLRRKDNKPLPSFTGRPERPTGGKFDRKGRAPAATLKTIKPVILHENGCLVAVASLHDDMAWASVKASVNKALGHLYEGLKTPKGHDMQPVNFCGQKTPKGVVHMILSRRDNDISLIKEIKEIEIDGEKFPFYLEDDQAVAAQFFKQLPKTMQKSLMPKPFNPKITIGPADFESIDHLRKCCKELLDVTPLETELANAGAEVLKSLVSYHPDPTKSADLKYVKVGAHSGSTEKNPIRSFFVVKQDGSSVDFSYLKCLTAYTLGLVAEETAKLRVVKENEEENKEEEKKEEEAEEKAE